jgi:hypothetical protein
MGAVAGIASSVLSSAAQSGQKDNTNNGQVSQGGNISNAGNQQANIQNAQIQPAASNAPQVTSSNSGNGNMGWEQMAQMAKELASKREEPEEDKKTDLPVMF